MSCYWAEIDGSAFEWRRRILLCWGRGLKSRWVDPYGAYHLWYIYDTWLSHGQWDNRIDISYILPRSYPMRSAASCILQDQTSRPRCFLVPHLYVFIVHLTGVEIQSLRLFVKSLRSRGFWCDTYNDIPWYLLLLIYHGKHRECSHSTVEVMKQGEWMLNFGSIRIWWKDPSGCSPSPSRSVPRSTHSSNVVCTS